MPIRTYPLIPIFQAELIFVLKNSRCSKQDGRLSAGTELSLHVRMMRTLL
jgi:hypothetical protein